jgi:hypothetical protein
LLTPATVHCGQAAETIAARQDILLAAYQAHPERFVRGTSRPPALPTAVWINSPTVSEQGVEQLSAVPDQPHVSMADASQPIFLKFRPELSQTA